MINDIKNEKFYSPEELAEHFQISLSTLYKMIRSGGLPYIRLGKVYRIPASDLKRYLVSKAKGVVIREKPKIPEVATILVNELKKSSISNKIGEVWLFGSYARGDDDPNSDVDLLIVLEDRNLEASQLIADLSEKAMEALRYEELLSIIELSKQEWEGMKQDKYLLAQTINTEGVLLWKNL